MSNSCSARRLDIRCSVVVAAVAIAVVAVVAVAAAVVARNQSSRSAFRASEERTSGCCKLPENCLKFEQRQNNNQLEERANRLGNKNKCANRATQSKNSFHICALLETLYLFVSRNNNRRSFAACDPRFVFA